MRKNVTERFETNLETYKRALTEKGYDIVLSALKNSIELLEKTEEKLGENRSKPGPSKEKAKRTASKIPLEDKTFEELYLLAKETGLKGRSKMTKSQLKKSLARRLYH